MSSKARLTACCTRRPHVYSAYCQNHMETELSVAVAPRRTQVEGGEATEGAAWSFSHRESVASCFFSVGNKVKCWVWLLISNYETKRNKNTRLGFPHLKFIVLRSQNLTFSSKWQLVNEFPPLKCIVNETSINMC